MDPKNRKGGQREAASGHRDKNRPILKAPKALLQQPDPFSCLRPPRQGKAGESRPLYSQMQESRKSPIDSAMPFGAFLRSYASVPYHGIYSNMPSTFTMNIHGIKRRFPIVSNLSKDYELNVWKFWLFISPQNSSKFESGKSQKSLSLCCQIGYDVSIDPYIWFYNGRIFYPFHLIPLTSLLFKFWSASLSFFPRLQSCQENCKDKSCSLKGPKNVKHISIMEKSRIQ